MLPGTVPVCTEVKRRAGTHRLVAVTFTLGDFRSDRRKGVQPGRLRPQPRKVGRRLESCALNGGKCQRDFWKTSRRDSKKLRYSSNPSPVFAETVSIFIPGRTDSML